MGTHFTLTAVIYSFKRTHKQYIHINIQPSVATRYYINGIKRASCAAIFIIIYSCYCHNHEHEIGIKCELQVSHLPLSPLRDTAAECNLTLNYISLKATILQ